jgi:integrase
VALSRRLRTKLRDLWIAKGQPSDSERILPNLQPQNYAARHFAKVCEAARLDGRTPKDLRDTFASQLLTAGVQVGYVSKQLGHSDVSVTARHYAKWIDDDADRRPMEVGEGEVPADLIARIADESPHPAESHFSA